MNSAVTTLDLSIDCNQGLTKLDIFKKNQLRQICAEMIRKDLELLLIQHRLQDIFDSCAFYRNVEDEFSSIEQVIKIASINQNKLPESLIEIIKEEALYLLLEIFSRAPLSDYELKVTSNKIVKAIFELIDEKEIDRTFYEISNQFNQIKLFLEK